MPFLVERILFYSFLFCSVLFYPASGAFSSYRSKTALGDIARHRTYLGRPLEVLDGRTEVVLVLVVKPPQLLQSLRVVLVVLQRFDVSVLSALDLSMVRFGSASPPVWCVVSGQSVRYKMRQSSVQSSLAQLV